MAKNRSSKKAKVKRTTERKRKRETKKAGSKPYVTGDDDGTAGSPSSDTPPPSRPQSGLEALAWWARDQSGDQIRAMYEDRARSGFAATQSGSIEPPLTLRTSGAGTAITARAEQPAEPGSFVHAGVPPIEIAPTIYPNDPSGTIVVHNHITINIHSADFRKFSAKVDELVDQLCRSNELSSEVRTQAAAEITAGRALLTSSKADASLVNLFLTRPLKWLAEKAGSALVSKLANDLLALLGKMTGWW
jgi:hypothetical protein